MPFRLVEENKKQPLQRKSISPLWYIKESTIIFLTNRNRIKQHNIKNHQSNEHQTISTMPLRRVEENTNQSLQREPILTATIILYNTSKRTEFNSATSKHNLCRRESSTNINKNR
jgi:hypothetical protein